MLAQADLGCQATLSRSMALRVVIILRMTARMMTLGFLLGGGETSVEDFESGIVSASAQSGHVEHIADWQPTAVDAAMSFEPAAVEVIRGEADECSDLLAAHLAAFRQQGGEGEWGADSPHRGQEFITSSEIGMAGNDLSHAGVEQKDIGLQAGQATFVEAPQHGILEGGGLVLDRDVVVAKCPRH